MAFTRRGGRSPDQAQRGKEAPAAQDACPRRFAEAEKSLRGCSGGSAEGPRRGAAPNRPPLPHAGKAKTRAAQASQTPPEGGISHSKGIQTKKFRLNPITKKQASASAKARNKSFCGMGVWGLFTKSPLPPIISIPYLPSAPSGARRLFRPDGARADWWAVPEGTADQPCP